MDDAQHVGMKEENENDTYCVDEEDNRKEQKRISEGMITFYCCFKKKLKNTFFFQVQEKSSAKDEIYIIVLQAAKFKEGGEKYPLSK